MKPYPFASLNHLTVPCAIRLFPLSLGGDGPPAKPRATMAGDSPRDRGEQQKSADEGPRPSRRSHSLEPGFVSRTKGTELQIPRKRAQFREGPDRLSSAFLVPDPGLYPHMRQHAL